MTSMDHFFPEVPGQAFQRSSLVNQVADTLRSSLHNGRLSEVLPGERPLSDFLQVSRPVLRAALGILKREGLVRTSEGRWIQNVGKIKKKVGEDRKKSVVLLSAVPLHEM